MQNLRAVIVLTLFFAVTLPLMPVQLALLRLSRTGARRFPHWYHRMLCRILNISIHLDGAAETGKPLLIVANHASWLDIPVLSAVAPLSFVAKREVGTWPFVSWLAKLQRTVFVDRERRASVGGTAQEITGRLRDGDTIVLFAEGTSGDGNRVLPFQSSLFAAAKPGARSEADDSGIYVQTLALAYTHAHGVPLAYRDRPFVAWYGDMEMAGHAWDVLKRGPLDVHIRISDPVPMSDFPDRKALASYCEAQVRRDLSYLVSNRRANSMSGVETLDPGDITD